MMRTSQVIFCAALALAPTTLIGAPIESKQARLPAPQVQGDLQTRLENLGVAPAEAKQRLASLDTAEKAELQQKLDVMPAGGDSTVTIGIGSAIVIVLLLIIFL